MIFNSDFPPADPDEIPRISVIIPTHDRPTKLPLTLIALSQQEYDDFEVVVVHTGDEETISILNWFVNDLQLVHSEQANDDGASGARNQGLNMANGELIAFTDDDCVPPENWLKSIAWVYQEHDVVTAGGTNWPHPSVQDRFAAKIDSEKIRKNQVRGDGRIIEGGFELDTFGTSNVTYLSSALEGLEFRDPGIQDDDGEFQKRVLEQTDGINAYYPIPTWHIRDYLLCNLLKERFKAGRSAYYKETGRNVVGSIAGIVGFPLLMGFYLNRSSTPTVGFGEWACDFIARVGNVYEALR